MTERPPSAPEFDAPALAKQLLRGVRTSALATLGEDGFPFASLVTVATDLDGSPLLLMSRLAAHTLNLERDPRASLLLAETGKGDPLAHPRLTAIGRAGRTAAPGARARFLARHPKAKLYADFGDFSFWRLEIAGAHLVGGFGRIVDLTPDQVRTDLAGAEALAAAEAGAVEHMNADHPDALALYATVLAGMPPGDWRTTGVDPEGIDLAAGDLTARVAFPERVADPGRLRLVLKRLADEARERKA